MRQKKIVSAKRWRRRLVAISLALLLMGVVAAGNKFFEIKKVEVVGQGVNVEIDLAKIPNNLLFFPAEKLRQELYRSQPLLAQVTFQKKYPHTLVITALPRVPLARLQSDGRELLLDRDGVVIAQAGNEPMFPVLIFQLNSLPEAGEKINDQRVSQALNFIDVTREFWTSESITSLDSSSLRSKSDKTEIFFPQQGELQSRAATLQTLLTGFRIKGTLPSIVDLRFNKPIVTN